MGMSAMAAHGIAPPARWAKAHVRCVDAGVTIRT
jgi:hypothetical protein